MNESKLSSSYSKIQSTNSYIRSLHRSQASFDHKYSEKPTAYDTQNKPLRYKSPVSAQNTNAEREKENLYRYNYNFNKQETNEKYNELKQRLADKLKKTPVTKLDSARKILVVDLDETLVHSEFKPYTATHDIELTVNFDGDLCPTYVNVRKGAAEFLRDLAEYYDICIFTASLQSVFC